MTRVEEHAAAMMPSLRRLAPQIVLAGVLPLVGYVVLRPHVSSDATALAAVMVFPLFDIVRERRRHGHFEPIGMISLIGIAIGIVGAVVFHGDATLLKVRESLFTGVFGVVCLVSLAFNWGVIGALLWFTAAYRRRASYATLVALEEASPPLAPPLG